MRPLILAAALATTPLAAQAPPVAPAPPPAPAKPVDPAALAVARKVIAAVHTDRMLDQMMIQMAPSFGTNVVNALLANPAVAAQVNMLIAKGNGGRPRLETILTQEFMTEMRAHYRDIEEDAAREYASRFTADELNTILAFYSSGVGAKTLDLMPAISASMAAKGRAIGLQAGMEAGRRGYERAQKEMLGTSPEPNT